MRGPAAVPLAMAGLVTPWMAGIGMAGSSLLKLRLEIDTKEVDTLLLFRRGESVETGEERRLFGLWRRRVSYVKYARVLVYAKFKEAEHFTEDEAAKLPYRPGSIIVKLFQKVPQQDLEMIFPNVKIRMRLIYKIFICVPSLISVISVISTKLWVPLLLIFAVIGFWLGLRPSAETIDQTKLITICIGIESQI